LTPIELVLLPKMHSEDDLDGFIDKETIANGEK